MGILILWTARIIISWRLDQLAKSGTEMTVTLTNEKPQQQVLPRGQPVCLRPRPRQVLHRECRPAQWSEILGADGRRTGRGDAPAQCRRMDFRERGTTEAALASLPSGQGFVEGKEGTNTINLKFTADMQTSLHTSGTLLRAPAIGRAESSMLRIRASRSGQGSEALVVKDTTAVNGYEAAEDMQLLLDNSLQEIPMVYTLAGNRTEHHQPTPLALARPLGVLSNSEEPVQLTFSGMRSFGETLSLLDSQTGAVDTAAGQWQCRLREGGGAGSDDGPLFHPLFRASSPGG